MNPKRIEITPPDPCSSSPVPYAHLLTEAPINLTTLICSPYLTSLISEHDAEQQTHTHTSISSKQLIILSQLLRSSNAVPQRRPRTSLLLSFGVPNKSRRRRRRRRKDSREENKRKGEEKRERNSHKWGRGSAVQIHPSESTYKNKQKNTGEREKEAWRERERSSSSRGEREREKNIGEGKWGRREGWGPTSTSFTFSAARFCRLLRPLLLFLLAITPHLFPLLPPSLPVRCLLRAEHHSARARGRARLSRELCSLSLSLSRRLLPRTLEIGGVDLGEEEVGWGGVVAEEEVVVRDRAAGCRRRR